VIRNNLVKDIAATGSTTKVAAQNLDGDFIKESISPKEKLVTVAEQVLWEKFSRRPGFLVTNIEPHMTDSGDFLLATIMCLYPLNQEEIKGVEKEIQNRLGESDILLVVSSYIPTLNTNQGNVLFEWSQYKELTEQKDQQLDLIRKRGRTYFSQIEDIFLIETHFRLLPTSWQILFEVTGTRMMTKNDVASLKESVAANLERPLEVFV
jgi:hypothetical protein